MLDTEIQQQYDQVWATLPTASKALLNCPLPTMLGLPHNEKQQWLGTLN